MRTAQGTLVVVDGYSSGSQLPATMREHGWKCVHVRSSPSPRSYFLANFREQDYLDDLPYEGDVEALAGVLAGYQPSAVLPGTESGVVVADLLAAELGLPGNDPATSAARRDKYEMHNRLKAAGLRAVEHHLTDDLDDLLAWAGDGSWPVVVKPKASAGTDSVLFCANPAELADGFRALHGSVDQLGGRNDTVLAQRFLTGQEYFVNGVSGAGRHIVTEIWRADKLLIPGAGYIYDRSILLDPTSPEMRQVVAYVLDVLDVLGVRYGAHHTEIMVDEAGPTLVECASRLSGGLHRDAANHAVGASVLDLVGRVVTEGQEVVPLLADAQATLRHPLWQVQFISNQAGVVAESSYEEMMATLRSTTWLQRAPRPGDVVTRTTDLYTSPGIVFMSHPDTAVLEEDYRVVRDWERANRLFTVRARPPATADDEDEDDS